MLSIILMLMVNSVMLSYLIDRSQHVVLDTFSSQPFRLSCGVPQDSVLGQMLISLCISPLEDVIRAHGLNAMMYADDSQLYIIMRQSNLATALQDLTLCSQDIMSCSNMLKCNPKKTEIIHFSSLPSSAEPVPLLDLFFWNCFASETKVGSIEASSTTNISAREISCEQVLTFLHSVQLSLFLTQVTIYPSYFFITSHGMLVSLLFLACWCKFT